MTTSTKTELHRRLARDFVRLHPIDAATELEKMSSLEAARFLGSIGSSEAARVLARMTSQQAAEILKLLDVTAGAARLDLLDAPIAARILARSESSSRERLLEASSADRASELKELLSYRPDTAGALMDPEFLSLRPETSVKEALSSLRKMRSKRIHRLFVVDSDHRLLGSVRLRDLALAEPATRLEALLTPLPAVPTTAGREELVEILSQTRAVSLPVVDFEGMLVGVLRHDALIEAARDEAAGDLLSMVGAGKEERALSPATFAVRKRLPWLQVNLVTAFLAAAVVGLFENTIARNTALAILLPVVAGQSGNTGAQALAVTMRGLALREIRTRQWFRVCFKELQVGFLNGVAVALTTSLAVGLWSRSPGLALVIGVSMVISMLSAGFAGAAIPMILSAIGQDPAQSSSIILTTVTDVVGFFSFLGIATLLSAML